MAESEWCSRNEPSSERDDVGVERHESKIRMDDEARALVRDAIFSSR